MIQAIQLPTATTWTPEQVELVKRTVCKGASDDELKLFMHVAQRTGLDPFARQIYAVKRQDRRTGKDNMVIQTSIDGFRLIASRTEVYAGRDEAVFEYGGAGNPTKCKLTIYKLVQGTRCAFTATAKWDEYYPGDALGFMWKKLPETMLEKCCEAKALRMAFPAELSSVYAKEEMDQADKGRIVPEQPGDEDGIAHDRGYRIPAGKYAKRAIEEVDVDELRRYVAWIEDTAQKKGQEVSGWAKEFVERVEEYLSAFENAAVGSD